MSVTTTTATALDPLGIPDLDRASAPFELLPVEELRARAASPEWISARAFVRSELTRHNGDNLTKVPLRTLELHPLAATEMRATRAQLVSHLPSRSRRTYQGYELEGTMAWALSGVEDGSIPSWSYGRPGLSWCFAVEPEGEPGTAYALVFTEQGGRRRVLAWRRHELMSCVEPEAIAAELVTAAASPASAAASADRIAALCRGGRRGVLADGRHALRVAVEMVDLGQQMARRGHPTEGVWAHACEALAGLTYPAIVAQIRACVAETIALRPFLEARAALGGNR
ncbi:MAG TPA: hypothetical protein RMH99_30750 [Sandaracinaceae bacterium LLY-WYZ-13_1]|nr:hypothetical protein [Sandaracinaceae bacterium LLY-WYZ-13_1]